MGRSLLRLLVSRVVHDFTGAREDVVIPACHKRAGFQTRMNKNGGCCCLHTWTLSVSPPGDPTPRHHAKAHISIISQKASRSLSLNIVGATALGFVGLKRRREKSTVRLGVVYGAIQVVRTLHPNSPCSATVPSCG